MNEKDLKEHWENKHNKKNGPTIEFCFPDRFKVEVKVVDDPLPKSKKAWKCIYTGNKMMSDGYKMEPLYEGAVMEVKANTISRGGN